MKFRTAISYHNVGRLITHGNVFLLWCSALEALYTSHGHEHKGSVVATERIKWFLGPQTPIYEKGDVPDFILNQPSITVADVVGTVYEVRNFIAHGDIVPRKYFETTLREGVAGDVAAIEVLGEALSFLVRKSLLRILQDGLLHHFKNAATADAFFSARGLTKSVLRKKAGGREETCLICHPRKAAAGVSPITIAQMLGHSSTQIVLVTRRFWTRIDSKQ